ncbi:MULTISPECIES: BGTF surface domain-containing protein [Halorussus]|uniref:BGTF surface domain-containing protein n=1 Tax=Halorussus TaxID=1070314 RepID=UPI0013B4321E|nr:MULTISPECIES: BGTF surface domain-containing protein [Halorussus]NHN60847.1 hypothetical protein [Halorussus sp. JP-T4]
MTSGRRALAAALVALLAVASGTAASTPAASATAAPDGNGTAIVTDGEELVLEAGANQTIRGETDLSPGTTLSVNVEGDTFLLTDTTAVTDEQTFNVTLDLSDFGEQDVAVRVYRSETVLAEADGRIVCKTDCESTATDSDEESGTAADGPAVQAITEVTQNRTASVKVLFGGADAVTVSVGGPEVNYVVNGTVRDRDGDGRATVLFHTNRAGTDEPTLAVVDDNETRVVEASSETSLNAPLAPGSYDVRLYDGPNATGEVAAEGRVVVFEETANSAEESGASANDTATTIGTVSGGGANGSSAGESGDRFLSGVGMIAAGGVLAVLGVGVVLGLFRN